MNSNSVYKWKFIFLIIWIGTVISKAQYAPPVGQLGTTAIYKDSAIFVSWVKECRVKRGYQDISNPGLGFASAGDSGMVTGKAMSNGVCSLGDAGMATCTFFKPITNGPGVDF